MSASLANYEAKTREAIKFFWSSRKAAQTKQKTSGKVDAGTRGAVTSGKNMDSFASMLIDVIKANGLTDAQIIHNGRLDLTLPGFFRPTKMWDMLVLKDSKLIAAIELKSQVGSFGNNFNNRTEEAIGTAKDFWTAFREGSMGETLAPFLGWLMLVEDAPKSNSVVSDNIKHYSVREEFSQTSYIDRYDLLCKKLVQEQLYTAACVVTSPASAVKTGEFDKVSDLSSLKQFVTRLAGHIAGEAVA